MVIRIFYCLEIAIFPIKSIATHNREQRRDAIHPPVENNLLQIKRRRDAAYFLFGSAIEYPLWISEYDWVMWISHRRASRTHLLANSPDGVNHFWHDFGKSWPQHTLCGAIETKLVSTFVTSGRSGLQALEFSTLFQ